MLLTSAQEHQLRNLAERARELGAIEGAQRLILFSQATRDLSVEILYKWVDPTRFQSEIERAQVHKTETWQIWRNSLVFILLTWILFSISFVIYGYEQILTAYPQAINTPFLTIWLTGFHGLKPLNFFLVILVSFLLLTAIFILATRIQLLKLHTIRMANGFVRDLQVLLDEIVSYNSVMGSNYPPNDVNRVLNDAIKANQKIAEQAQQSLDNSGHQITSMLKNFTKDLATSSTNIANASQDLLDALHQSPTLLPEFSAIVREIQSTNQSQKDIEVALEDAVLALKSISQTLADNKNILSNPTSQFTKLDPEYLQFTAYYPKFATVETWENTLLVYTYVATAIQKILADATQRQEQGGSQPRKTGSSSWLPLNRGTQITIVPYFPGVRFDPNQISFEWVEDWHVGEFQFMAHKDIVDLVSDGEIRIYAGPLEIGMLDFSIKFINEHPLPLLDNIAETTGKPQKIFASYSHEDQRIALACREVHQGLGNKFFLDRTSILSGLDWEEEIRKAIDEADVFQLFWSTNAARSLNVHEEWKYAKQTTRRRFIHPTYWEDPMAPVPHELSDIHFAYMDISKLNIGDTDDRSIILRAAEVLRKHS